MHSAALRLEQLSLLGSPEKAIIEQEALLIEMPH